MDINLDGLGVIRELSFRDRTLFITLELEGLPDKPISITAEEIAIAPDGSELTIKGFKSDMPFLHTALNRFAGGPFAIPEEARAMLMAAGSLLNLKANN